MEQLSVAHLAALGVTAAVALAVIAAAWHGPGSWAVRFARGLGLLLAVDIVAYHTVQISRDSWSADFDLPFHLTDAAAIVAALALWRPHWMLLELTYFWGLTGSLLAILTPDLNRTFPDFFYFNYFVSHSGVVVAAVFLVAATGFAPRPGAVGRTFLATAALAAVAALANVLTGANYMFLAERPSSPSPLDLMGPWPWYIASAALVALALFSFLDAPFRRRRRVSHVC
jgi:hypothetical integral membrane protein (TIGR02206 family)